MLAGNLNLQHSPSSMTCEAKHAAQSLKNDTIGSLGEDVGKLLLCRAVLDPDLLVGDCISDEMVLDLQVSGTLSGDSVLH